MATDFEMYQGDVKSLVFSVVDTAGAAVTVTGATVAFVIATAPGTTALVSKSTGAGTATASGTAVTVPLTETDTLSLAGTYFYELEITDSSGNISTNRGRCTIHPAFVA